MSCHGGGSGEDQGPCSRLGLTHRRRVGAQLSRGAVDGPAPASICPVSDDQCVCGAHVTHTALLGSPNKPGASSVFPPKIQLPTRCSVKPEMSVATAGNSRTVLMPVAHHGCPIRARGPAHVRLKENGPGPASPPHRARRPALYLVTHFGVLGSESVGPPWRAPMFQTVWWSLSSPWRPGGGATGHPGSATAQGT